MSEIDLIPVDYRDWLSRRATLLKYAATLLTMNILILAAGLLLASMTSRQQAHAATLKTENAITQQQQTQLQQLREQQLEYERRWSLLRGLRAGAAVDDIFTLIDRSIVAGDLWFLDWSFRRAGVIVDGEQRGVETGYFVIVAERTDPIAREDLSVETHMAIHGQAKDHQALSKFVRALFEQPDIKEVNVQKTIQVNFGDGRVVDFHLTVVLKSASGHS
ncbi:MAG: PilN domain-containing protein [Gammaproteobacteria bacterium]|nr:PilN domain-containing protein [Gammaproteobacteria bacterium]